MNVLSVRALARIIAAESVPDGETGVIGVSTDTRAIRRGDCFFAIRGDRFDGHDYVRDALAKGAACAVVDRALGGEPMPGPVLKVPDTIEALGDLARAYRRGSAFKVVAITGSVGKTTTRQIVHHVLSRRFRVHQAQKSFNNHIGLPLTVLGAEPEDEIIVAELGANHPGEIAGLTRIAEPDIALVTNAHPAHLEGFGDLATIIREKLSIAEGLTAGGTLIVNGDIEPLVAAARGLATAGGEGVPPLRPAGILPAVRGADRPDDRQEQDALATRGRDARDTRDRSFRTFGQSPGVDYRAEEIACSGTHSTFTIRGTRVHLPLPGPGNVENALAAWAVCDQFGLAPEDFARAVADLAAVSMRAETLQIAGRMVLNDCYNANPASMRNALAMLRNLRAGPDGDAGRRLVFICGEMAELGPQSQALHEELGLAVAEAGVDLLVTVGGPPRTVARTAREAAKHDLQTRSFDDTLSVCAHMQEFLGLDDIILVKGSRTARLERVVQELIRQSETG